ncbi:2OG-Fe dioxygenase family protein [Streptomyces sp. BA2]|uniref:2OG-Fe dioxygenase family protein n=1 Tax=Streptomyces sp. BA2 TaxID=436595 RepID=UPI0013210607|nr:2OG-Fe dioxygenase family protein [Streptomyces sp. BA2]MWA08226.1 hypothetical protein [Streptomyces sp. BA2]
MEEEACGTTARDAMTQLAYRSLSSTGVYLVAADDLLGCLEVDTGAWKRFASHWEDLGPDAYAAREGTLRLRRYGRFSLTRDGHVTPMPHVPFRQGEQSNPLYIDKDRHLAPLTEAFCAEPVLTALLSMLGRVAAGIVHAAEWSVNVHLFRVTALPGNTGEPTPEGRHRDGVTLVSSLLVARTNAAGGQSSVFTPRGRHLLTTTLRDPGALLLGDDRSTFHEVTPIHPLDAASPAQRDVLVTTLTAR